MTVVNVLVLCTANVCRSPMAAALLQSHCRERGIDAHVTSAGIIEASLPVDPVAVDAMAALGLDISSYQPRMVTRQILAVEQPDLVITMSRVELRHIATLDRSYWGRAFTLKEIVRRASEHSGGHFASTADWVHRLGVDRRAADFLADNPDDDIGDPYGTSDEEVFTTARVLDSLLSHLVDLAPWHSTSEKKQHPRREDQERTD